MSEPISDQERAAWQAACDEATPGPWQWLTQDDRYLATMSEIDTEHDDMGYVIANYPKAVIDCLCRADDADEDFIVMAREALPRLLAENAALQAERDAARNEAARYLQALMIAAPRAAWEVTATQPPLPDPPDPGAPQQLGLLEDGA